MSMLSSPPPPRPVAAAAASDGCATLLEEAAAINEATGHRPVVHPSLVLAAWRGQEARARELVAASIQDWSAARQDAAAPLAEYASAVLYNGLGRYRTALAAAERACRDEDLGVFTWALAELVEAATRSGRADVAGAALRRLEDRTPADGTDWALGLQARSRALVSPDQRADALYREALDRLASGRIALHLARAQLVYGEWLRRQGRRVQARGQLRSAYAFLSHTGADGYAQRARVELLATGEQARRRSTETRDQLTAQEEQIARLAGAGYSNPEIGTRLFLSPRTVEWHLRKVFIKLDVTSRKELRGTLPGARPTAGQPAAPALIAARIRRA